MIHSYTSPSRPLPPFLIFAALITCATCLVSDAQESLVHPYREHARYRRQFDVSKAPQIDLNITVPYIFSARLYPYGPSKGDQALQRDSQSVRLHGPVRFIRKTYESITIHRDGFLALTSTFDARPSALPVSFPVLAPYWARSLGGIVYFRETNDSSLLKLAQSEVNIQFRYGSAFEPTSLLIVTWENTTTDDVSAEMDGGNVFQVVLIAGESASFVHVVYSKLLHTRAKPVAGFSGPYDNGEDEELVHFSLPGSGTSDALHLVEKSNIGIPGEWLFRIDEERIYLCGAGFQGLECVDSCAVGQWYLDCAKSCHCLENNPCNAETGECPGGKCNPGWEGSPTCEKDIDECADSDSLCPTEQPDCVNTAGAYLCLCFEYDNATNTCRVRITAFVGGAVHTRAGDAARPTLSPDHATFFKASAEFPPFDSEVLPDLLNGALRDYHQVECSNFRRLPTLSNGETTDNSVCDQCHRNAQCIDGECRCMVGWTGDGFTCVDVDECATPGTCGSNAECENTAGSYQCVCNIGFIAADNGCVDLDECAEGLVTCHGGNTSQCVNTVGGYECRCRNGYTGTPESEHSCIDINECDASEFYCGPKATCRNLPGSFQCDCLDGYEKAGSSNQCVDMNECLHSPCDSAAYCTNLEGTFRCDCAEGFVGNGIECHETILYPVSNRSNLLARSVNAVGTFKLDRPLTLFGSKYELVYISSNGLLSFDRPFHDVIRNPTEIRSVNFFALHLQYDLARGGTVSYHQLTGMMHSWRPTNKKFTDADAGNYGLLSRASLTIQNKFHLKNFRATSLCIVTYRDVQDSETQKVNTFQVVVAQGDEATFVTFLYENAESMPHGVMGISHPGGFMSVPVELLLGNSNIGQRGKWLFRVDQTGEIGRCPAGLLGPPLCQQDCPPGSWGFDCANKCQCANNIPCDFGTGYCSNSKCAAGFSGASCSDDIDECALNAHNCHSSATCTNTIGSYTCTCQVKFHGDGYNCTPYDECYTRFGSLCADNARCDAASKDFPECVCNEGYLGDGRRECRKGAEERPKLIPHLFSPTTTTTTATTPSTSYVTEPGSHGVNDGSSKKVSSEENPFVVPNWTDEDLQRVNQPTPAMTTRRPKKPTSPDSPLGRDYGDVDNSLFVGNGSEYSADTTAMLFVVIPCVLVIVWLILVIAVIVCCCKRCKTRSNKYSPHSEISTSEAWTPTRDYASTRHNYFSQFSYT